MHRTLPMALAAITLLATASSPAFARPVTYAGGHVLVLSHQPTLDQWRYTHSPSFRWSVSVGGLRADHLGETQSLDVDYLRAARLLYRWNLPEAQANAFLWGGIGQTRSGKGDGLGRHVGLQLDYETRRIYTALVSELHEGDGWSHRFDTVMLGWSPHPHDVDRMASWVVLKGMHTSNTDDSRLKGALVLRFFTTRWWLEAGADEDGRPLANLMVNF